jgi:hypothetical protein
VRIEALRVFQEVATEIGTIEAGGEWPSKGGQNEQNNYPLQQRGLGRW